MNGSSCCFRIKPKNSSKENEKNNSKRSIKTKFAVVDKFLARLNSSNKLDPCFKGLFKLVFLSRNSNKVLLESERRLKWRNIKRS